MGSPLGLLFVGFLQTKIQRLALNLEVVYVLLSTRLVWSLGGDLPVVDLGATLDWAGLVAGTFTIVVVLPPGICPGDMKVPLDSRGVESVREAFYNA